MNNRIIWQSPWGYLEGFIISFGILACGFSIDLTTGENAPKLSFPFNLYAGLILTVLIAILFLLSKKMNALKWFFSIPAAIGAIISFTLLSIAMAFIPINAETISESYKITSGWAYFLIYIYLILVLGLVVLKRIRPINSKNIGFFLNHFGLWLTLTSAGLGSGDIHKLTMQLEKNKIRWTANDESNREIELPFAFVLKEFRIEDYNPKFAIIESTSGFVLNNHGKPLIFELPLNKTITINKLSIQVNKFLPFSILSDTTFLPFSDFGAAPAAYVSINGKEKSGWITCGNYLVNRQSLIIDSNTQLVMLDPEPKKFVSDLIVYKKEGGNYKMSLEVNKPLKISGYKIYQTNYKDDIEKWSRISSIELIKDPWLPLVFTGCFLMIAGAIYLIYQGKLKFEKVNKNS